MQAKTSERTDPARLHGRNIHPISLVTALGLDGWGRRLMPQRMKPKIDKLYKAAIDEVVNFYGSFK